METRNIASLMKQSTKQQALAASVLVAAITRWASIAKCAFPAITQILIDPQCVCLAIVTLWAPLRVRRPSAPQTGNANANQA